MLSKLLFKWGNGTLITIMCFTFVFLYDHLYFRYLRLESSCEWHRYFVKPRHSNTKQQGGRFVEETNKTTYILLKNSNYDNVYINEVTPAV